MDCGGTALRSIHHEGALKRQEKSGRWPARTRDSPPSLFPSPDPAGVARPTALAFMGSRCCPL
eukprot:5779611-Heterocapsa_arctica.AAC.1